MRFHATLRIGLAITAAIAPEALAQETQPSPLPSAVVPIELDTGWLGATGAASEVAYSTVIDSPGALWIRLRFDQAALAGDVEDGTHSYLIITSLQDGHHQILDARSLRQWKHTSAYFNGDAVQLDLVAHSVEADNRIVISEATIGIPGGERTICGTVDDRTLSSDPRAARILPVGCTGWMIDDCNHCFLTAGHCQGSMDVVQFNVPLSTSSGGLNHPPPSDQYTVDDTSTQGNGGAGVGDDWAYFGVFPNSTTGMNPFEAQGASYVLDSTPPAVSGQSIRVTGYGSVSAPVSPTWYLVQKTHVGPYAFFGGSTIQYVTDTTGGNSGSPVIEEGSGAAIGIHTHGGCGPSSGANNGTGANHPGLQAALASPQGVCAGGGLLFTTPNGLPPIISSAGDTIRVEVAAGGASPQPNTGRLHYDAGAGVVETAMTVVSANVYDAIMPALPCGTNVEYYFSAEGADATRYYGPGGCQPPAAGHLTVSADSITTVVVDDFQDESGWTVGFAGDDATTGVWNRMNPQGTAAQPEDDHTEGTNGRCWVTDGNAGTGVGSFDVDNGKTTLLSPVFDLSATPNARVRYWRWYNNSAGAGPNADVFVVDLNNGAGWVNVETVGPAGPETAGGWILSEFHVAQVATPTATVQFRFIASDENEGSIVEAALDDFEIYSVECAADPCPGDLDDNGVIDITDISILLSNFGTPSGAGPEDGDLDGDGDVDISDLSIQLSLFGSSCG